MTEAVKRAYTPGQDDDQRERLLMEQLPQVRYIARRIHDRLPRHVLLEDMVHAGVVGLIDALQKFDGSKHVQFGSYAKFRIRGAILDSLREMEPARPAAQSATAGGSPQHLALQAGTQSQRA
jgi:RNA polymerase sigma factor (sigma-70 family)